MHSQGTPYDLRNDALAMMAASVVADISSAGVASREMSSDSRRCCPGTVFLAYPGISDDGRAHLADAVARGAAAVVWESDGFRWPEHLRNTRNFPVRGLRTMAGFIAAEFYGHPSKSMWVCGVTGTNGKTTTTQWLAAALDESGVKTTTIGTLGSGFRGQLTPTTHTTPDAIEIQRLLALYKNAGAHAASMEVSSHALTQARTAGLHLECAIFTNLTHDHLDYHGTMQAYGEAKAKLFEVNGLGAGVVNLDDDLGVRLARDLGSRHVPCIGYSISPFFRQDSLKGEFVWAEKVVASRMGLSANVNSSRGCGTLELNQPGMFNLSNALAVLGALIAYGLDFDRALQLLERLPAVPGRMQKVGGLHEPMVIIDFAHTPDALSKVIQAIRPIVQMRGGCLWTVFGAGGDRDASKRPLMGAIAETLSDRVIVTSDNPRTEEPLDIISEVLGGIKEVHRVHLDPDRARAIEWAIRHSASDDVVLIAGKGHEGFQEIRGLRTSFSDIEVARDALIGRKGTSSDQCKGGTPRFTSGPKYPGGRRP